MGITKCEIYFLEMALAKQLGNTIPLVFEDSDILQGDTLTDFKRLWFLWFVMCKGVGVTNFYVSPHGNDTHPGTQAQPFRTLETARDAVRRLECKHDVTIHVLAGRYQREAPFEPVETDSRPMHSPIVYRSYDGVQVFLDVGRLISSSAYQRITDPKNLNFKLKKNAAVFHEIPGFEPISFEEIDLFRDPYRH